MKKKLTLSINQKVINKSRKYARLRNQSLSSMVEGYLASLPEEEGSWTLKKGSIVDQISGIASLGEHDGKSYDELLEEELLNKHGIQENSD